MQYAFIRRFFCRGNSISYENKRNITMGIFSNLFKKKTPSEILNETLEKGSANAQLNLGYRYETGEISGTPDYEISMSRGIRK